MVYKFSLLFFRHHSVYTVAHQTATLPPARALSGSPSSACPTGGCASAGRAWRAPATARGRSRAASSR